MVLKDADANSYAREFSSDELPLKLRREIAEGPRDKEIIVENGSMDFIDNRKVSVGQRDVLVISLDKHHEERGFLKKLFKQPPNKKLLLYDDELNKLDELPKGKGVAVRSTPEGFSVTSSAEGGTKISKIESVDDGLIAEIEPGESSGVIPLRRGDKFSVVDGNVTYIGGIGIKDTLYIRKTMKTDKVFITRDHAFDIEGELQKADLGGESSIIAAGKEKTAELRTVYADGVTYLSCLNVRDESDSKQKVIISKGEG